MSRKLLLLSGISVSLLMGGCTLTGSASFKDMSSAYRGVLEDYSNDNILLNVVRASRMMPLSFLDMPSVVGTGSVQAGASIGGSITSVNPSTLGGYFSAATGSYSPAAQLAVTNGFNFTQSSLDNAAFETSFLTRIRPDVIANLASNEVVSKSIMYSMVIESIEARDSEGKTTLKLVNNPYSANYSEFQRGLYLLIKGGLSTEVVAEKMPLTGPMDTTALNANMLGVSSLLAQPGVMLVPTTGPGAGAKYYQVMRMSPSTRVCLQKESATEFLNFRLSSAAFCSTSAGAPVNVDAAYKALPERSLVVNFRSPRNIFDYLGALVNLGNDPKNPKIIKIAPAEAVPDSLNIKEIESYAKPMFVVEKNQGALASKPLISINYAGDSYTVPASDENFSKEVIVILSQILSLAKVAGAIPASPAVLIK